MHFIEREVIKLIKKHKTNNPYEICEGRGIKYKFKNMHEEIKGVYQYVERNKFIYINEILKKVERHQTCCHELGHNVIHKDYNCVFLKTHTLFNTNRFEKEAEIFTACMYIPDSSQILKYRGISMEELAFELSVPKEYLNLRLDYMKATGQLNPYDAKKIILGSEDSFNER